MANYAESVLAKAQAVVTARNQAPEQRRKVPTVMELALRNSQFSIPNANDLRVSEKRVVEIDYFLNKAAGSGTAKAALHTGTYHDSGKTEVTYVTHIETFSLPRKIAQNNVFRYEQIFSNMYELAWKNLRTRHDTSALAFTKSARCQLSAATINAEIASANPGTWEDTNFSLGVDANNGLLFIQKAKSLMAARKMMGEYDVISDLQMADMIEFAMNQGAGNATNTSWQYAGCEISKTQDVIESSYSKGAIMIMPRYSLSGLVWNDPLNVSGVNSGENEVGMLTTTPDPLGSGAIADLSMYTGRSDTSANTTGGSTQDILDQYELALTVGYVVPPLSTSGDGVVHLVGLSS